MNGKILSVFVTNLGKYTEGGCYVALVDTPVEYARGFQRVIQWWYGCMIQSGGGVVIQREILQRESRS